MQANPGVSTDTFSPSHIFSYLPPLSLFFSFTVSQLSFHPPNIHFWRFPTAYNFPSGHI
ncbi:hypothetical protein M752DRAFT_83351 [Aspergillus phoenicis ATCC 13157]|uniref:Uncharacterized protein n=1 Tax=Aspergillus niger ATCC 13496 TaxID=1353008 RepID=A0A370BHI4_ASPNG|nr:hypothetical protein M747DRAFT_146085 [Aspergillus niger ATCC 13496]RDK37929.1 hypothetical protein M752DRAFT_83351 [Aspergillus phoenicis ATCC 13157]